MTFTNAAQGPASATTLNINKPGNGVRQLLYIRVEEVITFRGESTTIIHLNGMNIKPLLKKKIINKTLFSLQIYFVV